VCRCAISSRSASRADIADVIHAQLLPGLRYARAGFGAPAPRGTPKYAPGTRLVRRQAVAGPFANGGCMAPQQPASISLPELAESLELAFEQMHAAIERLHAARVSSPVTSQDHAEAQLESMRRYLVEDCMLAIASELLMDERSGALMMKMGLFDRLTCLCRAILHWRAHPETEAGAEIRTIIERTPIAQRPAPFNTITKPLGEVLRAPDDKVS
jgi:hypothetical protein